MARTKGSRVVYLPYSPDAAPSDFFLFGCLKGETEGFTANSPVDFLSEIRGIFQEISKETFMAVDDEWITQLELRTKHKGEYHHTSSKKSSMLRNE
jgi:hypothetical protein